MRAIREIQNAALSDLTEEFAKLYPTRLGRPSIPLYIKGDGQPARLCYLGRVLMENRHRLAVTPLSLTEVLLQQPAKALRDPLLQEII